MSRGVITREQFQWAASQQPQPAGGVAAVLLEAGLITEADAVAAVAEQIGVPFVDLDARPPDPRLAGRIPAGIARVARAVPVAEDGGRLVVALADPTDADQIARLEAAAGSPISPAATPPSALDRALDQLYPVRPAATSVAPLDTLLGEAVRRSASDLHLTVGKPPGMRIHGAIWPLEGQPVLTAEMTRDLVLGALTPADRGRFEGELELDASYMAEGVGRFRLNVFLQRGAVGAVLRAIPLAIPEFGSLGLPRSVAELANLQRGLVLVTGPTGSGKSTTLASLVDIVNRSRRAHIMTVEDPIEFLHSHKQSVVNQREVGQDTRSFADALKHVLRQDPDVILVGEMRDLETISTAITAAETGHLVFGTLHTQSAPQSVDRIVDVFPAHQQQQIRTQLAETLRGVVTQQLIPAAPGGRVVAAEVLIVTHAVRTLIREGKTHQIETSMQSGAAQGMQTMDACLAQLVSDGRVSLEVALDHCHDEDQLRRLAGPTALVAEPTLAAAGRR